VEISKDVHAIAHQLHSSKLEYLGAEAAMRGYCREFGQQRKVEIDFESKGVTSLSPEVSLCLYRVLQEALHNSTEHSRAGHFNVELIGSPEGIHLAVRDSGIGFDPKMAIKGQGLGLISMQERVKLVNGKFQIESHPGTGTTVRAWIPLSNKQSEEHAQRKVS